MGRDAVSSLSTDDHPESATSTVLHLFSGPYVTINGRRSDVPDGSKRLLAFMALKNRQVERRFAAGTLWPEGGDRRAAGNLRSALWRLRGAGIDFLTGDKWTLVLREDVVVDLHLMYERSARLIDGRPLPSDLVADFSWEDALHLMPGWYDDWVLIERERTRQRMLHGLEALSAHLIAEGRTPDAVDAAMLAVAAEPLRESAQRALIEAHLAEGNRVEAARCFSVYRANLLRELGIGPSAQVVMLVDPARLPPPRRRPDTALQALRTVSPRPAEPNRRLLGAR